MCLQWMIVSIYWEGKSEHPLVVVVGNPHPSICKNSMRESGAETILSVYSEKGEKSMEVLVLEIKATILHLVVIPSGAKPYLVQEQRSTM